MPGTAQYDPRELYNGLVENGLIIPVGVNGVFGRGAVFENVLQRFDELVVRLSSADKAEIRTYPPVICRSVLERVNYLDSFPHLCGAVYSFLGDEQGAKVLSGRIHRGEPWGDLLGMSDVVLSPAACYPLYPTLSGCVPAQGRVFTMHHWVFRHEPSTEPTRMQSFRVREFVKVGPKDSVVEWRDTWLQRGVDLLQSLGLPARPDVASDPFFGRSGEMLSASQIQHRLKFEVLVPVISEEKPTAVCSFNFHQDHFGSTFDIRMPGGEVANTACLGFGLERVVMALFKKHGFQIDRWPREVRDQLWS